MFLFYLFINLFFLSSSGETQDFVAIRMVNTEFYV